MHYLKSSSVFAIVALTLQVVAKEPDRPLTDMDCEVFHGGFNWQPVLNLPMPVGIGEKLYWNDELDVLLFRKGIWHHKHHYTFTVDYPAKAGTNLTVTTERRTGDGDGQQFLLTLFDKDINQNPVEAYWLRPNTVCTVKAGRDASVFGGLDIQSRDYETA